MPVLVASRPSVIARGVIERVAAQGGEVRAYGPGAGSYRGSGAIPAVGDLDDEGRLEAAMAQVHTVVHLPPGILTREPDRIVDEVRTVTTAATNAGVRRLVTVSLPGATADAADPVRRAHAEARRVLEAAPLPTIVVQLSLVDTPVVRDVLAGARLPQETRQVTVAPVRADDAVAVLVALDEVRSEAHEGHVVFHADGPRPVTFDDLLAAPGWGGSRVGRVYRSADEHPWLLDALGGPWTTPTDDLSADAWEFTGVRPRSST